jgi:AcrR family transcriptional regulator
MSEDTRGAILRTARLLFIRQGYTATSMRQVAIETGIAKATIYHHFSDKQALAYAMLDLGLSSTEGALNAISAETDPRGRIRAAAENATRFLFEFSDIIQIVRRELPGDRMKSGILVFFKKYMGLLVESVKSGITRGIFRPIDPEEAARVFMTMVQGTFAMSYLTGVKARTPEQASASLLDVFFHGIDAR